MTFMIQLFLNRFKTAYKSLSKRMTAKRGGRAGLTFTKVTKLPQLVNNVVGIITIMNRL